MRHDQFQEAVRPRMPQDYAPGGPLAALDDPYASQTDVEDEDEGE